jgi:hypothetical protein
VCGGPAPLRSPKSVEFRASPPVSDSCFPVRDRFPIRNIPAGPVTRDPSDSPSGPIDPSPTVVAHRARSPCALHDDEESPMKPFADWKSRAVSPADALSVINSGDRVYIHAAAATPTTLLDALVERTELENVRLYHLHLEGDVKFLRPEHEGRFFSVSLFTGPAAPRPGGRRSCRLHADLPEGHPRPLPQPDRPARRRADAGLAAGSQRRLHARNLGRRGPRRVDAATWSSPRSTRRCRARTGTR